jgi:hypothetical protein
LEVENSSTNILECGRIKPSASGEWELLEGVSLGAGTNFFHAQQAVLKVNGVDSGQLILRDSDFPPFNFFSNNLNLNFPKEIKPK